MSDMQLLEIFKSDAIEALADNERVIAAQKERIEVLEFHLGKLRDLLWLGYCNTNGVLPIDYADDDVKKTKPRKMKV